MARSGGRLVTPPTANALVVLADQHEQGWKETSDIILRAFREVMKSSKDARSRLIRSGEKGQMATSAYCSLSRLCPLLPKRKLAKPPHEAPSLGEIPAFIAGEACTAL